MWPISNLFMGEDKLKVKRFLESYGYTLYRDGRIRDPDYKGRLAKCCTDGQIIFTYDPENLEGVKKAIRLEGLLETKSFKNYDHGCERKGEAIETLNQEIRNLKELRDNLEDCC